MDSRVTKTGGAVLSATVVAGIGAVAVMVWSRHFSSMRREHEELIRLVESLRIEVDVLRKEVAELKGSKKNSKLRTPVKILPTKNRGPYQENLGAGDAGNSLTDDVANRGGSSYQSMTSDAEYADAEEDWEDEQGEEAIGVADPPYPSGKLPLQPMSFVEVDQYFGVENVRPGYDILKKRYEAGDKSCEVLWRLAKFCYELGCRTTDKGRKKELTFEGKQYALEGHRADENDFEALRWAAIMTGQSTDYLGTKEKIEEGAKFKELLDEALDRDSKDWSLLHLRGRYAYSVAGLSWIERKAAAVFYSAPPTATIEEALEDFLAAYEYKPDWIENLLYISRIYYTKGDKVNAKKYLSKLLALKPKDEAEREMHQEAKKLLAKC